MMKPGTQKHRLLSAFYTGRRLHRFDAEELGAHALPSVVSGLEGTGLKFDRRMVTVPTRWGSDAHVTEYWLAPESYPLAARLLGMVAPQIQPEDGALAYRKASGG